MDWLTTKCFTAAKEKKRQKTKTLFLSKEDAQVWNWELLVLLSHVWFFVTPWTVVCQAPLSMGFSRQEYWSGWSLYDYKMSLIIVAIFYSKLNTFIAV